MPTGLGDEIFWMCPSLESNPVDISPSARTLTLNNGTSLVNDTGQGGSKAYEFDGADDDITTTVAWGGGPSITSVSWSIWLYYTGGSFAGVFGEQDASNNLGIAYYNIFNVWRQGISLGDGTTFSDVTNSSLTGDMPSDHLNAWHHHAMVWEGTETKLYIDGSVQQVMPANETPDANDFMRPTTFLQIGLLGGISGFQGRIDDFRAYDRALSESEITRLASSRAILGDGNEGGGGHINRTLLGVG